MDILLYLWITVFITSINYVWFRRVLYPPVILGLVWAVVFLVYFIFRAELYPMRIVTGLMIIIGVIAFSLGGALIGWMEGNQPKITRQINKTETLINADWIIWVSAIGLPFLIFKLWKIGDAGSTDNLFMNIRIAMSAEDVDGAAYQLGILNYLSSFAIFGAGFHALGVVKSSRIKVVSIFMLALMYAFLSTGRTYTLFLFCLIAGGFAISGKVELKKLILIGTSGFILMFSIIAFILNKGIGLGNNPLVELSLAMKEYFLGGVTGLNDYLASPHPLDMGSNSFRTIAVIVSKFDDQVVVPRLVKEFRNAPLWTNVYTVFRPYFQDFGWTGVIISQVVFGAIHSLAFYRALEGKSIWVYLYGLLLYPLVMQFFQDQYFSLLSTWGQALIFAYIVLFMAKLEFPVNKNKTA
jgi:oligosaccharide repeat unit polymerase